MIFVHCTLSHCQKHAYQAWSHLKLWLQSYALDKKCSVKSIKGEQFKKRNKVELRFLCSALRVIARNMHTMFGVIWTYNDKVTLRTRKAGQRGRGHGRGRHQPK